MLIYLFSAGARRTVVQDAAGRDSGFGGWKGDGPGAAGLDCTLRSHRKETRFKYLFATSSQQPIFEEVRFQLPRSASWSFTDFRGGNIPANIIMSGISSSPVHSEKDTSPIIVKLATRMASTITVKNFMQRMDRLKELTEDQFKSTTETTHFVSQIVPISHPEAIHDDDNNPYKVAVEVQLLRQVSWHF